MTFFEQLSAELARAGQHFVGPEMRFFPVYLLLTLPIVYMIYRRSGRSKGFIAWLFPAQDYFHASHMTDLKLLVFGRLLAFLGFFKLVAVTSLVGAATMTALGGANAEPSSWNPFALALLIALVSDFGTYWVHRLHHTSRILWPFHAVHHSAEVMTPVTAYRKHPIYDLLATLAKGALLGLLQGILLALFVGQIGFATLAGTNFVVFLFNALGSNLRHSHVWLSYGPVLEHIFISPAQHHIHHSLDPKHWNKNHGQIFAVWDWMFGSLYIPQGHEKIRFGLSDASGQPIPQPHDGLQQALVQPFIDSWRAIQETVRRFAPVRTNEA